MGVTTLQARGFLGRAAERDASFWVWVGKRSWWAFLAIVAVNIALKAPYLGGTSLFLDEAVAIHETQGSVAETLEFSASDPTPPLYYLLLAQWCKLFGISEASARFPSMLLSALTAGLIFLIGRRFFAVRAGVYASLMFTCSNVALVFSHEARAYALASLLMCCSYYAFLALAERQDRYWWPALALFLANAALLYTHYVTAMGIAAQALMSLWLLRGQARRFLYYVGSQVLVLAVWMPWLLMNRGKIPDSKVTSWLPPPNLQAIGRVYDHFAGLGGMGIIVAGVLIVGGVIMVYRLLRNRAAIDHGFSLAVFAAWALLALGLQILVSRIYMPVFEVRYALYAFPGICLLLGAVLASLPIHAMLRNGVGLLYLAFAIPALNLNPQKPEDWRGAVAQIQAIATPKTGMVVNAYYQFMPLSYYLRPAYFEDFQHTMPLLGNDQIHLGADTLIVPTIDDSLITDVILVLSHNELVDPEDVLIKYMRRHYCLIHKSSFEGIKLMQFANPPCASGTVRAFSWDYETAGEDNGPEKFVDDPIVGAANQVTFVAPQKDYSASYSMLAKDALGGEFSAVELRFKANPVNIEKAVKLVFVMDHAGEAYNWNGINLNEQLRQGVWTDAVVTIQVPEIKSLDDKLMVYFWTNEGGECYFDDLELEFVD